VSGGNGTVPGGGGANDRTRGISTRGFFGSRFPGGFLAPALEKNKSVLHKRKIGWKGVYKAMSPIEIVPGLDRRCILSRRDSLVDSHLNRRR
jgi:hypothetical protein